MVGPLVVSGHWSTTPHASVSKVSIPPSVGAMLLTKSSVRYLAKPSAPLELIAEECEGESSDLGNGIVIEYERMIGANKCDCRGKTLRVIGQNVGRFEKTLGVFAVNDQQDGSVSFGQAGQSCHVEAAWAHRHRGLDAVISQ